MNFHIMKTGLYSAMFFSVLVGSAFAGHPEMAAPAVVAAPVAPAKFYIGGFGGGGSSNRVNATQFATAFFTEDEGGPLAVDAFGHIGGDSVGFGGAQMGYQAQEILLYPDSGWAVAPAFEIEGYAFGNSTFTGDLINNTARLPEHDFAVSYSMKRSVFLTNVVVNLNYPCLLFHPYVGAGIGGAVVKISGADAEQIAPVELGINHYNASTNDTTTAFAGQIKVGLSYDFNDYISVFAEYRWLYIGSTHFNFGSTVYPTHAPTSDWQVLINPQHYNLGSAGIRFNL